MKLTDRKTTQFLFMLQGLLKEAEAGLIHSLKSMVRVRDLTHFLWRRIMSELHFHTNMFYTTVTSIVSLSFLCLCFYSEIFKSKLCTYRSM